MKVGVLALQGAFAAHARCLRALGAEPRRGPHRRRSSTTSTRSSCPGGESTTMSMLLESSGLFDPLAERLADGLPALGTCAGMILLGAEILDGRPDQRCFGAVDIAVRRNAFGRQVDSFEADLAVADLDGGPFRAVFIRAPFVERVGRRRRGARHRRRPPRAVPPGRRHRRRLPPRAVATTSGSTTTS